MVAAILFSGHPYIGRHYRATLIIVGAGTGGGVSLPELQIWRNVRGTSYTKASFSILSSSTVSDGNNTVEYIPNPPLKFQEGDILGVYLPQNLDSALIVYNQEFDGPVNYEEGSNALSTVTLGSPDVYDYPLVTVEISTYAGTRISIIIAFPHCRKWNVILTPAFLCGSCDYSANFAIITHTICTMC